MKIFEKIEILINGLLIKLSLWVAGLIPQPVKNVWRNLLTFLLWPVRKIPELKNFIFTLVKSLLAKDKKTFIQELKTSLGETYKKAILEAKAKSPKGMSAAKTFFMTPFLMFGQWLSGLSQGQSLLLLGFSSASFIAMIGIGFSGHKLINDQSETSRHPASSEEEEEVVYDRPLYYKKETRHLQVTSFRLPIYLPKTNELRSVDIDFIATTSNRSSRQYLEKHEFQLRDHLIHEIEPSIASFSLDEEGKEILRQKLHAEINAFLTLNKIQGEVIELQITYVLAN